jgi:alpha-1,2-mannosyltransferase
MLLLIGVATVVTLRRASLRWADFVGYIECGEAALAGRFGPEFGATMPYWVWPPFFAYACLPLALLARLGDTGPRLVWALANLGLAAVAVNVLADATLARPRDRDVVLIAVASGLSFLASSIGYHQLNLLVLVLVLLGARAIARGEKGRGGALLGLAAALKVWPAFLLPYLFLRGERRASLVAGATGAASLLAPAALFGPSRAAELTFLWLTQSGPLAGGAHHFRNQSLGGVLARTFSQPDWGVAGLPTFHLGGLTPEDVARVALLVGAAAFLGLSVHLSRGRAPLLVDLSVLMPASLLLVSPLLWRHYLVCLLGILLLAAEDLFRARRPPRALGGLAILFVCLVALQEPAISGEWLASAVLAYHGGAVLTVVALSMGLVSRARRLGRSLP